MGDGEIRRDATISDCGLYRYTLVRRWGQDGVHGLAFLTLNPSTADAAVDDPTIRRCIGFARRDGYGGVGVFNLYAYRATDPSALRAVDDPVGPDNDWILEKLFGVSSVVGAPVVCAWGASADPARVAAVMMIARRCNTPLFCLGLTKDGHPRHPLYVRGDAPLVPFPTPADGGARVP